MTREGAIVEFREVHEKLWGLRLDRPDHEINFLRCRPTEIVPIIEAPIDQIMRCSRDACESKEYFDADGHLKRDKYGRMTRG